MARRQGQRFIEMPGFRYAFMHSGFAGRLRLVPAAGCRLNEKMAAGRRV